MRTNLILEVTYWDNIKPSISIEMTVSDSIKAEEIAQKLNDISIAKDERKTIYYAQPTTLPAIHKKEAEVDDDEIPF